jgi:hypothetical protein
VEHLGSATSGGVAVLIGIPTLGLSPHLESLVIKLRAGGHDVRLICNGSYADHMRVCQVGWNVWMPRRGIYNIWNVILGMGRGRDEPVAIFNDDIDLEPDTVDHASWLFSIDPGIGIVGWDPDPFTSSARVAVPVRGAYREGGVTGCAFAIRPASRIRFDEEFTWWGGDDDIVYQYLLCGYKAVKMVGCPVLHWPSTSANQRPEVMAHLEQDRQRLLDKWGRTW